MAEKFTKGYVDLVIDMRADKEEAKHFLRAQLNDIKRDITDKHYSEIKEYIENR